MRINLPQIKTHHLAIFIRSIALAFILFAIFMFFQLSSQNKALAKKANTISMQNQLIAKESQQHIDCIAALFARYTRDNKSITIEDMNTCQATEAEKAQQSAAGIDPLTTSPVPISQNKTVNSQQSPSTSDTHSNTQTSAPSESNKAQILGMDLCLPFTEICVKHHSGIIKP